MSAGAGALAPLDRLVIGYLVLPLLIFLTGWFKPWAALPLLACTVFALRPLLDEPRVAVISRMHIGLAIGIGVAWTVCGGTGHLVFANADWPLRDAVLHDLVTGAWPVGYAPLDGDPTLLRAPLGFYLPAALVGKVLGLPAAHVAMAAWTALGATLFLLEILSVVPAFAAPGLKGAGGVPAVSIAAVAVTVIVLFSGLDIVGNLWRVPDFRVHWNIARHLEWWAGAYQYSSMTTQLFWVPNHALGGWLAIGMLCRERVGSALERMWPLLLVAVALWSPLTALGLAPFVLGHLGAWALRSRTVGEGPLSRAHPPALALVRDFMPALIVGAAVAAYLTLDSVRIPKGLTFGRHGFEAGALVDDFVRQGVFILLEAGLIGAAVLMLVRSGGLLIALLILAVLPLFSFGPSNDLVMRASIPSLALLAIGAAVALVRTNPALQENPARQEHPAPQEHSAARAHPPRRAAALMRFELVCASRASVRWRKLALAVLLAVGAVTPLQEFARAAVLKPWPINLHATLIDAACGGDPAHYVARVRADSIVQQVFVALLGAPHPVRGAAASFARASCRNPANQRMRERGLL